MTDLEKFKNLLNEFKVEYEEDWNDNAIEIHYKPKFKRMSEYALHKCIFFFKTDEEFIEMGAWE